MRTTMCNRSVRPKSGPAAQNNGSFVEITVDVNLILFGEILLVLVRKLKRDDSSHTFTVTLMGLITFCCYMTIVIRLYELTKDM